MLASDELKQLRAEDPKLAGILDHLSEPHKRVHQSAAVIDQVFGNGEEIFRQEALHIFDTQPHAALEGVETHIAELRQYFSDRAKATTTDLNETLVSTHSTIVILATTTVLLGILMVWIITRGITGSVK